MVLDHLLPHCFAVPLLSETELRQHIPNVVAVPGDARRRVTDEDKNVVLAAAKFVTGYVAENL